MTGIEMNYAAHALTAIVDAELVEDEDKCLAAAVKLVAEAHGAGFDIDGAGAEWDSDQRWSVVVTCQLPTYRIETTNGADTAEELGESYLTFYPSREEAGEVADYLVNLIAGTHYEGTQYRVVEA